MDTPQTIQLLSEIKSAIQASAGSKYTIALIASASGILGASIPAVIQYLNNKSNQKNEQDKMTLQIKTEIVTKQRQEWINSIRTAAIDLLAEFNLVYNHVSGRTEKKDLEEQAKIWFCIQQKMLLIDL